MKFNYYALLSQLVLGVALIAIVVWLFVDDPAQSLITNSVMILVFGYILGYFLNAIGSWIEDILFWTWGGKPSRLALEGKLDRMSPIEKALLGKKVLEDNYSFDEEAIQLGLEAKQRLKGGGFTPEQRKEAIADKNRELDGLFSFAYTKIRFAENPLVNDLNAVYAFGRNLVATLLLLLGISVIRLFVPMSDEIYSRMANPLLWFGGLLGLLLMAWWRAKERGEYFAREVFSQYLYNFNSKEEKASTDNQKPDENSPIDPIDGDPS